MSEDQFSDGHISRSEKIVHGTRKYGKRRVLFSYQKLVVNCQSVKLATSFFQLEKNKFLYSIYGFDGKIEFVKPWNGGAIREKSHLK
jgi:hypothetical protein